MPSKHTSSDELRHILGYCVYTPDNIKCDHRASDDESEQDIKAIEAYIKTNYIPRVGGDTPQPQDKGNISDGYHTFNELYEHRIALFRALCTFMKHMAWKSKLHEDGTMYDGWFIAGINLAAGDITYHIPMSHWELFNDIDEVPKAYPWDGHTPTDVIERLHRFVGYSAGATAESPKQGESLNLEGQVNEK